MLNVLILWHNVHKYACRCLFGVLFDLKRDTLGAAKKKNHKMAVKIDFYVCYNKRLHNLFKLSIGLSCLLFVLIRNMSLMLLFNVFFCWVGCVASLKNCNLQCVLNKSRVVKISWESGLEQWEVNKTILANESSEYTFIPIRQLVLW